MACVPSKRSGLRVVLIEHVYAEKRALSLNGQLMTTIPRVALLDDTNTVKNLKFQCTV